MREALEGVYMENKAKEIHVKIVIDNLEEIKKEIEELENHTRSSKEDIEIEKIKKDLNNARMHMKRLILSERTSKNKFYSFAYLESVIRIAYILGRKCATKDLNKRNKENTMS